MTARRPALIGGALAAAALVALALLAQLARPPVAFDDSNRSPPDSGQPVAAVGGEELPVALPRPAPEAIAPLTTDAATPPATGTFLEPRRWIGGQVVRVADGTPLVGAIVRAVPAEETPGGKTEEPDAHFKIWPRETTETLEVRLKLGRGWPHFPQSFPIEPGSRDRTDLRLVYDSGFTLSGTVTDQDGRAIPFATVSALASAAPMGIGSSTLSDEQGRYTLQDLTPPTELGVIRVVATALHYLDSSVLLPLTGEVSSVHTLDLQLQLGGTLAITVRLPSGEPVEQAEATVLTDSGRPLSGQSDDDGIVRIDSLPSGTHTVVAALSDATSRWSQPLAPMRIDGVVVEAGETKQLDVTLQPGATISGRVTDSAGAPVRRAFIRLEFVESPASDRHEDPSLPLRLRYDMAMGLRSLASVGRYGEGSTDAAGNFELAGVPAGPVRVVARGAGLVCESIELTLSAGEARSRVDLVLRPGMELIGHVTLADGTPLQACTKVLVLPPDLDSYDVLATAETGPKGDFRADGIEPGPKRLVVIASDGSWVDAPAQPGGEPQTFVMHR